LLKFTSAAVNNIPSLFENEVALLKNSTTQNLLLKHSIRQLLESLLGHQRHHLGL
jgi:hypothetical protein